MRLLTTLLILFLVPMQALAGSGYDYQLYKNHENHGIVIFPKTLIFKELSDQVKLLAFTEVQSGKTVMRKGSKNENETLMMPLEVQEKHSIEKFLVIQILGKDEMLAGIYDPEWGLTLPTTRFNVETLIANISKTLNVFRGSNPQRQTRMPEQEKPGPEGSGIKTPILVSFSQKPDYNIRGIQKAQPIQRSGETNACI